MLCYLSSKLRKKRDGKPDFFVCQWVGVQGDVDAKKTVKDAKGRRVINVNAAKARTITLTKCIFPVDDDAVKEWDDNLEPVKLLKVDEDTGEITEKVVNKDVNDCTWLYLKYVQVPLVKISETVKRIQFTSNASKILKQDFITVIGFCDEEGVWVEELTAEEMAKNNLINNLSNDVYIDITNEEESEKDEEED